MDFFLEYKKQLYKKGGVYLKIKAHPGADKTLARGILEAENETILKIDIAAKPEKGRANRELIKFLAEEFKLSKGNIKILSGTGDKIKLLKIII